MVSAGDLGVGEGASGGIGVGFGGEGVRGGRVGGRVVEGLFTGVFIRLYVCGVVDFAYLLDVVELYDVGVGVFGIKGVSCVEFINRIIKPGSQSSHAISIRVRRRSASSFIRTTKKKKFKKFKKKKNTSPA